MIDVADEGVDALHALHAASGQPRPFVGAEHTRNDVERDQAFRIAALGIDREGDAQAAEDGVGLAPFQVQPVGSRLAQPFIDIFVDGSHGPVGEGHFIESWGFGHAISSVTLIGPAVQFP